MLYRGRCVHPLSSPTKPPRLYVLLVVVALLEYHLYNALCYNVGDQLVRTIVRGRAYQGRSHEKLMQQITHFLSEYPNVFPIPLHYPLQETRSDSYAGRTARNVRQSDGTLVLTDGRPDRGTALTIRLARRHARPLLLLNLAAEPRQGLVAAWIVEHGIGVLNVAGPRASSHRGIYEKARRFLHGALAVSRPG